MNNLKYFRILNKIFIPNIALLKHPFLSSAHLPFQKQKQHFSESITKTTNEALQNLHNVGLVQEVTVPNEEKVEGIDVDEEMQRYSYEEFEEVVEEEEDYVSIVKPRIQRGVEGVFDPHELEHFLTSEKMLDVVTIAISPDHNFCSHMLIASARSKRQLRAVAEKIRVMFKQKRADGDLEAIKLEGSSQEWLAIDLDNLVVHLMMPEVRQKYCLERLWSGAEEEDMAMERVTEEFSFDEELKKVKLLRKEMDGEERL